LEKFASATLKLDKDIKRGDKESLQTLFDSGERYTRMEVLRTADEDSSIRVVLEGLGQIDLKLGDDMEKGQKKTIMTLFWFLERAKPIEMMADANKGDRVTVNMYLIP
jgi:hypothetical protein